MSQTPRDMYINHIHMCCTKYNRTERCHKQCESEIIAGRPKGPRLPPLANPPPDPIVSVSPIKSPPFVPKLGGRRFLPRDDGGCILIRGTNHTLRSDLPFMPRNSTCKVCYLNKRVGNRSKGGKGKLKGPRRTIYACDKCRRMLCPSCFRKYTSHGSLESVREVLVIE